MDGHASRLVPSGPVAHLVERLTGSQKVVGSIPIGSTYMRTRKLFLVTLVLLATSAGCESTATPTSPDTGAGLVDRAKEVVRDIFAGEYEAVRADFDETMLAEVSEDRIAQARANLEGELGTFESLGEPAVLERGELTVFNIPLLMSEGEGEARITYWDDGRIAGLYLLPRGVPVP